MKNLETKDLFIRKPKMEDAKFSYENWFSNSNVAYELDFKPHGSIIETKAIIMSAIRDSDSNLPIWIIEIKETKQLIGYVKMSMASYEYKKCNVIYYILSEYEEEFEKDALQEIVNYLLKEEGFETIIFGFYDTDIDRTNFNKKVLKRIGAKKEGVLRNRKVNPLTGKKDNKLIYSIIKEDLK